MPTHLPPYWTIFHSRLEELHILLKYCQSLQFWLGFCLSQTSSKPSPGIAGDIKRLLPLEFGSTWLETWISFYVWESTWKSNLTARWHFSLFPPFLTLECPELFEVIYKSQTKKDIGISLPNLLIFLLKWTFILISLERECPFLFLLW